MAYTTAIDLTDGQIAMVGAARFTLEHNAVWTNTVTKMTLGPGEKSILVPKFGKVTAKDLTDGVDMTEKQSMTMTGTTHSTDEAGCCVVVTKKLANQLKEDAYRAAGKIIGNAMAKKIDTDGLGLFSGLSTGLGNAGTTMTMDIFLSTCSQLYGQAEPAPPPFAAVLHPYHLHELIDGIATPSTNITPPDYQMDLLRNYWRGSDKLFGVPIFIDGNISVDSAADAYSAIYSKLCFIYLVGWEPETWSEYDGSLRGTEIGIVADYGVVEEDDGYGRYILCDATAPTS